MWAFFSRRLRMWLLFSIVIPAVRRLWGRAKANRMARNARAGGPGAETASGPASAKDPRTF